LQEDETERQPHAQDEESDEVVEVYRAILEVARGEVGRREDDGDLGKLRWLQREAGDGDPTRGTVGIGARKRREDEEQQYDGRQPDVAQQMLGQHAIVQACEGDGENDADGDALELALDIVCRIVAQR